MVKIYAVIDTNVLVSSLLSRFKDSATVRLIELLILGEIIPVYNDEIIQFLPEISLVSPPLLLMK